MALDDQALAIATAISSASLCWRCIVAKTTLPPAELDDALIRLQRARNVVLSVAPCHGCQRDTLLYQLG